MIHDMVLLAALLVVLAACLVLAGKLVACYRSQAATAEQLKSSTTAEKAAVRQLRLASHNLRAIGMTLQGHTEHLGAGGAPDTAGIASAASGIFDAADYMHEWAEHAESTHVLNEEVLSLRDALDEAISTVALATRPGRRTWHVDPEVLTVRLRADRRALRHVLTRALSVSVRSSGHDDGIDIWLEGMELENTKRAVALVIEEQAGPDRRSNPTPKCGGPDLRLTLARTLMQAHGGKLDVEQGDGLSVRITFPAERVIKATDDARESPKVDVARGENDDRSQGVYVT